MELTNEQLTALTNDADNGEVLPEPPNEFAGISDRELLEHLVRKVAQFETLAGQLAETAASNPMARMALAPLLKLLS